MALKRGKLVGKKQVRLPENEPENRWQICSRLFKPLSKDFATGMALLREALERTRPLNSKHRKELPEDIRRLSRILTSSRAELRHSYWADQSSTSAYIYYFLPWNIIRLGQLFSALPLPDPARLQKPLLLDLGSGLLALPLALWLCHAEWRKLPIHIVALDNAPHALETGRKIFNALAELQGEPVWQISCINAPVKMAAAKFKEHFRPGETPWLLACANVLNELANKKSARGGKDSQTGKNLTPLDLTVLDLIQLLHKYACPGLFVEPGTRLGALTLMKLREAALSQNLFPAVPCTHDKPCPLLDSGKHKSGNPEGWCHFTFLPSHIPQWLLELSEDAGLVKHSLSLSVLFLEPECWKENSHFVRVISQAFPASPVKGLARYGCAKEGLVVLEGAQNLPSGTLVEACAGVPERRDSKRKLPIFIPLAKEKS